MCFGSVPMGYQAQVQGSEFDDPLTLVSELPCKYLSCINPLVLIFHFVLVVVLARAKLQQLVLV